MAEGSFAVVSSGGTGMGRAIAEAFARDGTDVLVLGRRPQVLAAAAAARINTAVGAERVRWLAADLGDPSRVAEVAASVERPVDVLVNAADGVARDLPEGTLAEIAAAWIASMRLLARSHRRD